VSAESKRRVSSPNLPDPEPTISYWMDDADMHGVGLARHECDSNPPAYTDILIIGGGISGVSVLYELASLGLGNDVTLVDARQHLACGATGRNGGIVQAKAFYDIFHLVPKYGIKTALQLIRFEAANRSALRRFVSRIENSEAYINQPNPCDYYRDLDAIMVFDNDSDFQKEAGIFRFPPLKYVARAFGIDILTRNDCQTLFPKGWARGAIRAPKAADFVSAARITRIMAKEASEKGAKVCLSTAVLSVHKSDKDFEIHTSKGLVRAQKVVYATNAWTSELLPSLTPLIRPVINHVTSLHCADGSQEITGEGLRAFGLYPGYNYWVTKPNGRVILGGFRQNTEGKGVGILEDAIINREMEAACDVFADNKLGFKYKNDDRKWTGILGFSRDNLPIVGRLPNENQAWICAGFSGHGLPVAPLSGASIARDIAGDVVGQRRSKLDGDPLSSDWSIEHPPAAFKPCEKRFLNRKRSWESAGDKFN